MIKRIELIYNRSDDKRHTLDDNPPLLMDTIVHSEYLNYFVYNIH